MYDDKPMSASVPPRVTCTVVETPAPVRGIGATPQYVSTLVILLYSLTTPTPFKWYRT